MGLAFRITGNFQSCCFLYGERERERRKRRCMAIWRVCMCAKSDKDTMANWAVGLANLEM